MTYPPENKPKKHNARCCGCDLTERRDMIDITISNTGDFYFRDQLVEWTPPTVYGKHGVAHGRATARIHDRNIFGEYIQGPIHNGWLALLNPGGFVAPHIDGGEYRERWHIPLLPAGYFWEDGESWEMLQPFIVRHWLPHAVWNPTDRPRIHLMIEREIHPEDAPDKPGMLEVLPVIPEIQEMIDRLETS